MSCPIPRRHPVPSAVAGHPQATVSGGRPADHPAPHRGVRGGAADRRDPDHRLLSGRPDGAVRQRNAAAVRRSRNPVGAHAT